MPKKLVQVFVLGAFITHIFSATYTDSDVLQPPFCESSESITLASDPGDGELHDGMENVLTLQQHDLLKNKTKVHQFSDNVSLPTFFAMGPRFFITFYSSTWLVNRTPLHSELEINTSPS